MALLSATGRARVAAALMRGEADEPTAYTKPQLAAAIDAADDWVEANAAAYNSALPVAFRTSATATQKTLVLAYVLWRRIGRLHVSEDG